MKGRFRLPMFAVAAALLALIAVLATLQYRWLGRISDAERERLTATLSARAAALAQDFDRELTLAYILFQLEPALPGTLADAPEERLPARLATRHERWQTTARHPKLIREYLVASAADDGAVRLQRFNPATRVLEPAEWPAALDPVRVQLAASREESRGDGRGGTMIVRTIVPALWEQVPALVVPASPSPRLLIDPATSKLGVRLASAPSMSYIVLLLDRGFIGGEMLPALVSHHFAPNGDTAYQLAVVDARQSAVVYHSVAEFSPAANAKADAAVDLFQVKPQEFPQLVADVRRFTALMVPPGAAANSQTMTATFSVPVARQPVGAGQTDPAARHRVVVQEARPAAVIVDQAGAAREHSFITTVTGVTRTSGGGKWRLLVKHPSGSLEAAVASARRRNLWVSMGILGVLSASMVMLVLSTRRSQQLARQQMEFVAAVSHELRTPLAVVRSAADNLADGLVRDDEQVRKYGALVRSEGRRLTEMVEQILELAGIHSGQRTFTAAPVRVEALIDDVLRASGTLIEAAQLAVEVDVPSDLPPVSGDESALRRVIQNLVGNAIKYGADGKWIGITARRYGNEVAISVSDRGIGIAPAEHQLIFEPFYRAADVVAAQVQGAGLGLSLVRRILQAHGGRITLRSSKAAGSDFTIYLPVAAGEPAAQTSRMGADAAAPVSRPS